MTINGFGNLKAKLFTINNSKNVGYLFAIISILYCTGAESLYLYIIT